MKKLLSVAAVLLLIGGGIWLFRPEKKELTSVGFLFPGSMYDQTWGTEGYKGMLDIVQTYDTAFFYEQNINTRVKMEKAIKEMAARKVNILFGQGKEFSQVFNDLASQYPDINFVVFNGKSKAENVTAVNIDGYSMGFFSGMVAGHQTDNNRIGVIGAYNTQPDIRGFIDGAQYENPKVKVVANYISTFGYDNRGEMLADRMIKHDRVDVLFPAADGVNADIMMLLKDQDVSGIGYIIDQSGYGPQVLTSLQLNLAKAYADMADRYTKNQLQGGTYYFGVKEGMVQLGEFSYRVDPEFQQEINKQLKRYESERILPNGRKDSKDYFESYLKADH
ncbi:BMP family ABC transporter substrate-binding protein [Macrococcus equipercicus]|uniref:BMP family ABC transporter substrate-binding protein n=1 Tax=Macrococcus equipercicus TaxID=69967 RepID=A0A9Q9F1X9_9STAP|nr:BMP family ABC transporter substrate-binding protein [Macrococcus equipercicus]KAA1042582.1 BMP family ABC transporter substrate-binding protein [Macrococcus equipercicus]UTH14442.1 BMP family ABC transporter substrate-binding protein [Macrococcus equipercicus]